MIQAICLLAFIYTFIGGGDGTPVSTCVGGSGTPVSLCPNSFDFHVAQNAGQGTLSVTLDQENKEVCFKLTLNNAGWTLEEEHFQIEWNPDYFPKTGKKDPTTGNLIPGTMTGMYAYPDACNSVPKQHCLSYENLQGEPANLCGALLYIAHHAVVVTECDSSGNIITSETGWTDPKNKPGSNWFGFPDPMTIECKVVDDEGPDPPPAGCETSWARYMGEDGDIERIQFQSLDSVSTAKWGWCNVIKTTNPPGEPYTLTLIAGQQYDGGLMKVDYQCDATAMKCTVTFYYTTVGASCPSLYLLEKQVRISIKTDDGTNVFTVAPGQYEHKVDPIPASDQTTTTEISTSEGCIKDPDTGKCKLVHIHWDGQSPYPEIVICAHAVSCGVCEVPIIDKE